MRLSAPAAIITAVIVAQAAYLGVSRAQMPTKRQFVMLAIEPRGGANIAQEPFPSSAPPSGAGYVLRSPDQSGRWEMSAYVWAPSQIIVNQGDEVEIEFIGINGASHPTEVKGFGKAFELKRGQVARIDFTAEKPGTYAIICSTHEPTMRAEIVVLPKT